MEFFYRATAFVMSMLFTIFNYICGKLNADKAAPLPAAKNPLLKLSARQIAKKIRDGELRSEAVTQAYIARIKEVDPFLNALLEDRFEEALRDAQRCDQMLQSKEMSAERVEKEKPLLGVPISVKESCSLKGLSLTGCTLVRRGMKATEDSTAVELLKNAGAIPLCVTNTPELCSGFESSNYLLGCTRNPYDTRRISGGSSGGEAALIGAGASLIGIGSDIGGSIRLPALFCGTFGHKPTPGILPIKGHFPISESAHFQKYLVLGPLSRTADDLGLAMKILSARCQQELRLDEPLDLAKLRVFFAESNRTSSCQIPTEHEISRAILKGVAYLREKGAHVQPSTLIPNDSILEISLAMFFGMEDMPKILIDPNNPKQEKSPLVELAKGIFGLSQYTKSAAFMKLISDMKGFVRPSQIAKYQEDGEKLRRQLIELLGDDGVIILPTFPRSAPFCKTVFLLLIEGAYCLIWNVLGFPSTHVPMGLNNQGLPVGFQVVAAPYQDRLCLSVAKELENGFGGWVPPTPS